jgi:hypothetical protein
MKVTDLVGLPSSQAARLRQVRRALEIEKRSPCEFRGKRLQSARDVVSIPLGRRWRAIFLITDCGYQFRDCLSHESYNHLSFAAHRG